MSNLGHDIKEKDFIPNYTEVEIALMNKLFKKIQQAKKDIDRYQEEGDIESVLFAEGRECAYKEIHDYIAKGE